MNPLNVGGGAVLTGYLIFLNPILGSDDVKLQLLHLPPPFSEKQLERKD